MLISQRESNRVIKSHNMRCRSTCCFFFLFIAVCHRLFKSTKTYAQFCQIIFSLLFQSIYFFSFHAFKFQNGVPYWVPEEEKNTRDKHKKKKNANEAHT